MPTKQASEIKPGDVLNLHGIRFVVEHVEPRGNGLVFRNGIFVYACPDDMEVTYDE